MKTLEHLAGKTPYETLPANWNTFDLQRFSEDKRLWDYQQNALKLALVALYKYYEDFLDYEPEQNYTAEIERKEKLTDWYDLGMALSAKERKALDLNLKKAKLPLRQLLAEFYEVDEEAPQIDFKEVCNRMSFWMATGSGKTLVLVKLLELLHLLMQRDELPVRDILFLTCREDLIDQFKETVEEYNRSPENDLHIELKELRDYPEAKRETPGGLLGRDSTLRVFFYRSDNLSDEHKEAIVDFRNYYNDGKWFVLLDEAHKGDSADSKRKQIFSILSRAGFLFNFSATFTDAIDLATTVHNFNLSEFIERGYGKHLTVLKQELAAFKKDQSDYSDEEKRKIVAKSMLLLAFTAKKVRELRGISGAEKLYHHPMLLALVNSVNTDDADLKLYFEQILAIGRGKVAKKVWEEAKKELWLELKEEPAFLYEDHRKLHIEKQDIASLSVEDVWREVYNLESTKGGEIEVLVRPGNRKELAFQMKASGKPFALIKIGDVTEWLKQHLSGFEYNETFDTESFFKGLNAPDSSINILMGSRSFYEGWDSHRPNVINFVNIGTGETAKKFIMQSVGRGVRVRSWRGARQRLEELVDDFDDKNLFRSLRPLSVYPETLYVLGTNRDALNVVLGNLKDEKPDMQHFLELQVNPDTEKHLLLIPRYLENGTPIVDTRAPTRFELTEPDFELTRNYGRSIPDDNVLLLAHGGTPQQVQQFRNSLEEDKTYYSRYGNRSYRNLDVLVGRIMNYFNLKARELDTFSKVESGKDIVHFSKMSVDKAHAEEIQQRVNRVLESRTPEGKARKADIENRYKQGEFDFTEAARIMEDQGLTGRQSYQDEVCIDGMDYLARHFYLPIVYSTGRKVDYLRHIIDAGSEVEFLEDFKEFVSKPGNRLSNLKWWMFSKLDQYLDVSVCIPYYDPTQNKVRSFVPDFIFWGFDGKNYRILFVDPKGMVHDEPRNKIAGYKRLFEANGKPKTFTHGDITVSVHLCLYNRRRDRGAEGDDRRFWFDDPQALFDSVFD
jgi:hypothetical protein